MTTSVKPAIIVAQSAPDRSQRRCFQVNDRLAVALAPLVAEHGTDRVVFAMEGWIAAWVKSEAEKRKRAQ